MRSRPRSTACIRFTTNCSDGWDSFATNDSHRAFGARKGFVMAVQYLAANRFGLGRRFDDPPIDDPRAWLTRQIGDYDPAPAPLAALAGREAIATAYAEYRDERQAMRREANAAAMRDDGDAMSDAMPDAMPGAMRRMSRAGFRRHY